ncbi:MAG TPA: type II secretion system protein [Burkholderiales bacterium]
MNAGRSADTGMPAASRQLGFTLAEAIIVIVIMGVLASAVAVFIRGPVQAYFAVNRRAQLVDTADTALRRMHRELKAALPNSVRVTGTCTAACYLEFIPVVAGGRYRAAQTSAGAGNILDFTTADTSFDIIGPPITMAAGNSWLVVYNLGMPGADAYSGATAGTDVRRVRSAATGSLTAINFTSTNRLPFDSPSKRFQIVTEPVTYECAPGTGVVRRYAGYGFSPTQAAGAPGGTVTVLAGSVSGCNFVYTPQAGRRAGLVSLTMQLTQGGETISLYYQVHVSNVP